MPNTIGILFYGSPGNTASGNVASGNEQVGIRIDGATGTNNLVTGNVAGLDANAAQALPNGADGLFLSDAPGNLIVGNIATGNRSVGIHVAGEGANGNAVQGNLVGAAPDGSEPGNSLVGVYLDDAPRNLIGGLTPGTGNLIAGSGRIGIQISGRSAVGNVILGNTLRDNGPVGISSENAGANVILTQGPLANVVVGSPTPFQPVPTPGPAAPVLTTIAQGNSITGLVLAFDASISPTRARDRRAYRVDVLDLRGRRVGRVLIRAVVFDDETHAATLIFARAVPSNRLYRLTALGTGPRALTDAAGNGLDGAGTGGSGTDFARRFGGLAPVGSALAGRSLPRFRRLSVASGRSS